MLKSVVFSVICLALFSQCDLWNLPLTRSEEEAARMLQIREIYVAELPSPNVFADNSERPENAGEWEALGLAVYAVDGFGKTCPIEAGEQYELAGETPERDEQTKLTEMMTVTVTLQLAANKDITTSFDITLFPAGETYYEIKQYSDDNGRVVAYPSMVSKSEIESKGESGVPVTLYVYAKDGCTIKPGYPVLELAGPADSLPPPPPLFLK